ncbi:hypothetical protein ASG05_06400 [Frigoribacterium sp. Leaf186]|nr:hypothetical protein ASG05_06400 [Frigoribacterium sp. Leaf186]
MGKRGRLCKRPYHFSRFGYERFPYILDRRWLHVIVAVRRDSLVRFTRSISLRKLIKLIPEILGQVIDGSQEVRHTLGKLRHQLWHVATGFVCVLVC